MTSTDVDIVVGRQDPAAVERLLLSLPDWFGIEDAVRGYVASARTLPTVLAVDGDGTVVGALLWKRHFPESAEVHLMAVDPGRHREGVGRRLLERAEAELLADGVRWLQVKTLGPSDPDAGYARTRLFYEAYGFVPLEELHGVWPEDPMLIMVKPIDS